MMRCTVLAAILALVSAPIFATTYTLEPRHTEGVIRWSHLGFSNPTAQFSLVEGTLEFDQADPTKSSVVATIKLANMSSGVPDLDDDFRSVDFFDTAKFPKMTFKSTAVSKSDKGLKLEGDLTMHGVTKPVTLDVTGIDKVKPGETKRKLNASTTLNRKDFGVGMGMADSMISDKVKVTLHLELKQ